MFLLAGKKFTLPATGYGVADDGLIHIPACPDGVDGINYPAGSGPLFDPADRAALGITEVPDPVRPDERFFFITENADGTLNSTPKDLAPIKEQYKTLIDQACGAKRAAAISVGDYISEEYRRAYEDAMSYKAAGYIGTVPASVASWKTVSGMTNTAAADDIIATRDSYMALLDAVRDIRLSGKAAVDAAATSADILAAITAVNTSLEAL